jgi:hypothetical protein
MRIMKGHFEKGPLGPSSFLGENAEMKLIENIQKLQAVNFMPYRKIRRSGKN